MSVTRGGGRAKTFTWWLEGTNIKIRKYSSKKAADHSYSVEEIAELLDHLRLHFSDRWIPLANNVEKMPASTEQPGLGSAIYAKSEDTTHAQGASYLGVVLEEIGIFEWNRMNRGICWRLMASPLTATEFADRLIGRQQEVPVNKQ